MRTLLGLGALGAAALASHSFTDVNFVRSRTDRPQVVQNVAVSEVAANIPATLPRATDDANQSSSVQNDAVAELLRHLQQSMAAAQKIPAYTAVLEQQVYVGGRLHDAEKMEVKFRRAPFSVFLRWPEDNQQALYVEGQHDNRMLVRPTRGLVALRGTWRLRPDSPQALQDSRYPITSLGIEKLCEMILAFHTSAENGHQGMQCVQRTGQLNGRDVNAFEVKFTSSKVCPTYSKAIMQFDRENQLLLSAEHYHWGENDACELLERYVYHNLKPTTLTDEDFSHTNAEYNFQ